MRKLLLAGAALLGAVGWAGDVAAQANNANNGTAAGAPAGPARPAPGSIIVRLNGRVFTAMQISGSSLQSINGVNTSPTSMMTYMRLYPGFDGVAANGLRYGGAIELRQNFNVAGNFGNVGGTNVAGTGAIANNSAGNPNSLGNGYNSVETVYVRRAFAYLAGEQWGILRLGQGDGLISIMGGAGDTTGTGWAPSGGLNGGDGQTGLAGNSTNPVFMTAVAAGNEYTPNKVVYLSPQFFGFDLGLQYQPNPFNNETACGAAAIACPGLTSASAPIDGMRTHDMFGIGLRYQNNFNGFGVYGYGSYFNAGVVNYNGTTAAAVAAVAPVGSTGVGTRYTGRFDPLSIGSFGVALSYAGVQVSGNAIVGAMNGQLAARPQGAPSTVGYIVGVKYNTGPLTVGINYEANDYQGALGLTGITQRHEWAVNLGGNYVLAPGLTLFAEYLYQVRKQNGFNFATGALNTAGAGANNFSQVQGQGFMVGTLVTW